VIIFKLEFSLALQQTAVIMGSKLSTMEERNASVSLDKKEDTKKMEREIKLLLLGDLS
jgi:hypothetical protein